eukprot:gene38120-49985_t
MSRRGNCWDNAPMESFFGTLKTESLHHYRFTTREQARQVVFEYIEVFYNRIRRHAKIGNQQPRRDIDLMVLDGSASAVRSVVICPSMIYGTGYGLNKESIQIPFLVQVAKAEGKVVVVGEGVNRWSHVHIDDLCALILLALQSAPPGSFYFAEHGEASYEAIGTAISARLGLDTVGSIPAHVAAEKWGAARAYFSFGGNSRVHAKRARAELGWRPAHGSLISWIELDMPGDAAIRARYGMLRIIRCSPAFQPSITAFLTLLLIAAMMGANHVCARFAFNDGVSVTTAVIFRSGVTAMIIMLLLIGQRVSLRLQGRPLIFMPIVGTLVAIQSYCLYSAVARLPVALALLAFNTYPLWAAFWAKLIYRHQAEKFVLRAMPVILFGLALALDAFGAASGLGAYAHWQHIGNGVAFALTAAATFALAMVLTQHESLAVDARVRTAFTLSM